MYFRIGTNIFKCSVRSLNAESRIRSVRKDELYVAVQRSFNVLDMKLCEI
jgi:hypothetical protein